MRTSVARSLDVSCLRSACMLRRSELEKLASDAASLSRITRKQLLMEMMSFLRCSKKASVAAACASPAAGPAPAAASLCPPPLGEDNDADDDDDDANEKGAELDDKEEEGVADAAEAATVLRSFFRSLYLMYCHPGRTVRCRSLPNFMVYLKAEDAERSAS